jgi:hypothetical protein
MKDEGGGMAKESHHEDHEGREERQSGDKSPHSMTTERQKLRVRIIANCEERIARARVQMASAYKEHDMQGAALCLHSIRENERAIEMLRNEPQAGTPVPPGTA